jgi:hypothetical protein
MARGLWLPIFPRGVLSLSVGFSMVQLFQRSKHMQQPLTQEHVCTQYLVACIIFHVFYWTTAAVALVLYGCILSFVPIVLFLSVGLSMNGITSLNACVRDSNLLGNETLGLRLAPWDSDYIARNYSAFPGIGLGLGFSFSSVFWRSLPLEALP